MAKSRAQKEEIVARLTSAVTESPSVTFVQFDKLSVSEETEIRSHMREKNLCYYVAKKTLMNIAFQNAQTKGDLPELSGKIAIVYGQGEDKTASAREINEFVKKFKDKLQIVGGIFEGEFKSQEYMNEIASIPSLEILRGMFVNVVNSPLQKLVVALDQIAQKKA